MMNEKLIKKLLQQLTPTIAENKKQVTIISGAPGSGKSTYVQEHKNSGDLVLDMDILVSAIQGSTDPHPCYDSVMDVALAVREVIYEKIQRREGAWNQAFVITSSADRTYVRRLAQRLGGKIVQMSATQTDCLERIRNDATRNNPQKDCYLVERWYRQNQ